MTNSIVKSIVKEISSSQNDQFKYWKSLLQSKGLHESKHFLLSGKKLVEEVLRDKQWNNKIDCLLLDKDFDLSENSHLGNQLKKENLDDQIKIVKLTSVLFKELDVLGTRGPILVLEQPIFSTWKSHEVVRGLELLCPFGDPQNLGAVIRTAYAFGVSSIVLLKEAAHPLLPKSIKSSSGAVLKMKMFDGPTIESIENSFQDSSSSKAKEAIPIFALDLNGEDLSSRSWPVNSMRLLLGEEGKGIPKTFSGPRIHLTMVNPMESLNASVAAGIVIYQLLKK